MTKDDLQWLSQRKPGVLGEDQAFKSAVLLPLININQELCVLFEKRASNLKVQPGEICFPGGSIDPQDASPEQAAIRETIEELGIAHKDICVAGPLDIVVSPFSAIIYPFFGYIDSSASISLNESEVEEIFYVPLSFLLEHQPLEQKLGLKVDFPQGYPFELVPGGKEYPYRNGVLPQQFYIWQNRIIWGLTARILHHFLNLIKE